ncbi:hypothetical protein DY120_04130 [Apilactobacillus micheneri]|uniref:Uncharacterized protein n=1 Tax=Apilactobacillus micheneri TaxID=1899430 RepID=A0ABY2Z0L2_9LACO|nr:hypothetical protein DY114_04130 [Apilactobacillus micheneri]TPR25786.1 hypothetical protein DY111_04130 [Apilactobacillus micheneri]TPR27976.1 hypothetical protein DY113_02075 [Apilactobacillus micheneri]TPR29467.1 hypothetical protein DY117_04130 [Apilactobacillus micheneri]TPR30253.1 hypothetical protein DY120_04130 [Apilactobacillus micheneri]
MQTQDDKSYSAYISFQSILLFLYIMTINNMGMILRIISALILLGMYFLEYTSSLIIFIKIPK